MPEQRWLRLDGICTSLRLSKQTVRQLTAAGHLAVLWGPKGRRNEDARWLDPTPEYAEKLRVAAVLHQKALYLPPNLHEIALFTIAEVAAICGWKLEYAQECVHRKKIPHLKINRSHNLFTSLTVRDLVWRKSGRKLATKKAPFLIPELIEWFQKQHSADLPLVPADAEFASDDVLQRKLALIVNRSKDDQALATRDFDAKVKLAREVAALLNIPTAVERASSTDA